MKKILSIARVTGLSGSGKTSLVNEIAKVGFVMVTQQTSTRDMRPGETPGKPYNFVTPEEYEIIKDDLCFRTSFFGNNYGTSVDFPDGKLSAVIVDNKAFTDIPDGENMPVHFCDVCLCFSSSDPERTSGRSERVGVEQERALIDNVGGDIFTFNTTEYRSGVEFLQHLVSTKKYNPEYFNSGEISDILLKGFFDKTKTLGETFGADNLIFLNDYEERFNRSIDDIDAFTDRYYGGSLSDLISKLGSMKVTVRGIRVTAITNNGVVDRSPMLSSNPICNKDSRDCGKNLAYHEKIILPLPIDTFMETSSGKVFVAEII